MVVKIGGRPKNPGPSTVTGELLDCHERIRNFVAMSTRLSQGTGSPPEQIREAATRVRRYFTESLPRHSADEDESIAPRLRGAGAPGEVLDALAVVEREHHETDAILDRLIPLWTELESAPEKIGAHAAALGEDAARLDELFQRHLAAEEKVMIPAIDKYLDADTQAAIRQEMRNRRPQ